MIFARFSHDRNPLNPLRCKGFRLSFAHTFARFSHDSRTILARKLLIASPTQHISYMALYNLCVKIRTFSVQ